MRLLLAEDEEMLVKALKKILERNNYTVDVAYDGEKALEYLYVNEYDVIVLDIMMPKVDGLQVLKSIRSKKINTPVIMLTAKSQIDDKILGLDTGANDYLTKPFNTRELLARLRVLTRMNTIQTSSILSYGNISLDQNTYELSSPFGSYRLANKEYQMLELLISNPKHLISSERFMEKIWDMDSEAELNVVWVYISYLRKKLTSLKANVEIKATRNVGYSLELKND